MASLLLFWSGESNPGSYTATSAVKILVTPSGTALAISVFRPRAEKGYRLPFHSSPQVQVLGPGGENWIPDVESLIMPLRLPDCNVYHEAQPSWNCNSIWLHDKDIFLQYVDGTTKILWS